MRRSPVIAVAALAALVAAPPAFAGEVPTRGCKTRILTRAAPGPLRVGPVSWDQLKRFSDPAVLNRFRSGEGYLLKAPVAIAAGRRVTLAIAPAGEQSAWFTYGGSQPPTQSIERRVRFRACSRAVAGPATVFAGGFRLGKPGCVALEVRQSGSPLVWRRTVSFGMGDACEFDSTSTHVRHARVGCDTANGPTGPDQLAFGGTATVFGASGYRNPAGRARGPDGFYGSKSPLGVRRGRTVTISVAPGDRSWAELRVAGVRPAESIEFTACPRGSRPSGTVWQRDWSSWPGGFRLARLGCVHLLARERGSSEVQRAVVSFGMGDGCGDA